MIYNSSKYCLRLLILLLIAVANPVRSIADDADQTATRPVFRVVFFTPSDVEPPAGVKERLKDYVGYAQQFYGKWMNHWDYACEKPLRVERDGDGIPKILFVKGRHDEASGRYRQLGFEPEVIESACSKYEIDPQGQVWWIFTYRGPERRGFRGGGNSKRGGTSTSIYDPAAVGKLVIAHELGSDGVPQNSKASIHELGHAFGLPHIGPLLNDKLGNSLMGPVVKAYRSRFPDEARVYLTEASAAMLWKHPLFSGTTKDRELTPKFDIEDFGVTYDKDNDRFVVSGEVAADYPAHSIVVANASSSNRSDYWRKCFAGRIAPDDTFRIEIDELDRADGQLFIVCCFDNGAVVGKNGVGLQSGFVKQYHFKDDVFKFDEGWSASKPTRQRRGPRRTGASGPQRPPTGLRL
jgi:hypothetical protein